MASAADPRRARIGIIGTGWWATYCPPAVLIDLPARRGRGHRRPVARTPGAGGRALRHRRASSPTTARCWIAATSTGWSWPRRMPPTTPSPPTSCRAASALMLEKPMVLRAREARELVRAGRAAGRAAGHRLPVPLHLAVGALRARIAEGALGQLQLTQTLFASMVLEYYRANFRSGKEIDAAFSGTRGPVLLRRLHLRWEPGAEAFRGLSPPYRKTGRWRANLDSDGSGTDHDQRLGELPAFSGFRCW